MFFLRLNTMRNEEILPLFPQMNFRSSLPISPGLIAGIDEVGRGALWGPVVAGACIISDESLSELESLGVKDSKKLSARKREELAVKIRQLAMAYQIGLASVQEINRLNILQASLLAMKRAILRLKVRPEFCLIDGNQKIPQLEIPQKTMIKGDQESVLIASASIIAKVWRDELMMRLAEKYPRYDLQNNKGYGTPKHRAALKIHGVTPQHRLAFVKEFLPVC